MKSKLFKSLIAVLLVISLLPTAAFAAAASCSHADVAEYGGQTKYVQYSTNNHKKYSGTLNECRDCGYEFYSWTSSVLESHFAYRYVKYDESEESGETTYYYYTYCICGQYLGTVPSGSVLD